MEVTERERLIYWRLYLFWPQAEAFEALKHAADNVPKMPAGAHHVVGSVLRTAVAPLGDFGATTKAPTDALTKATADLLTTRDSDYVSTLLLPGVYTSGAYQKEVLGALSLCLEADAIERACKRARKHPTADEQKILEAAASARDRIVQVQAVEQLGHAARAPGARADGRGAGRRAGGARGRRRLNPSTPSSPLV